jgi:hypothetical protein
MAGSRDWERQQRRIASELERERRAAERERLAKEKAAQQAEVVEKKVRAQQKTDELEAWMSVLRHVLANGLQSPATISLDEMRRRAESIPLDLGDLAEPIVATAWELAEPSRPGALSRAFGGMRQWNEQRDAARKRYDAYVADVRRRERARLEQVARLQREHAERTHSALDEVARHNAEVDRIRDGCRPGTRPRSSCSCVTSSSACRCPRASRARLRSCTARPRSRRWCS